MRNVFNIFVCISTYMYTYAYENIGVNMNIQGGYTTLVMGDIH